MIIGAGAGAGAAGAGTFLPGAGAAEQFYSEPEPECFPGAGADQKCHDSASLVLRNKTESRFPFTEKSRDEQQQTGLRFAGGALSLAAKR